MKRELARWESRGGAYVVTLHVDPLGYTYRGVGCGGSLAARDEAEAMAEMERLLAQGYFQPDANKTPMRRVEVSK